MNTGLYAHTLTVKAPSMTPDGQGGARRSWTTLIAGWPGLIEVIPARGSGSQGVAGRIVAVGGDIPDSSHIAYLPPTRDNGAGGLDTLPPIPLDAHVIDQAGKEYSLTTLPADGLLRGGAVDHIELRLLYQPTGGL